MFNVSKEFAPPFGLIAPFFVAGAIFYLIAAVALLFYPTAFSYAELSVAGWVHLFLVGYVMMIIFGAMAQLVPVVLETGHFSVDWFYIIFPLLLLGTVGLVLGFWFDPILLSFGGLLVLVAMVVFAVEVFLTIAKTTLNSLTVQAVKISNLFLLFGILSGFLMALTLSGFMGVDIEEVLKAHVALVVGGYVMLTIYGITVVLLPMFGLAHGFDEKPLHKAFWLMVVAVVGESVGVFFSSTFLEVLFFGAALASAILYYYQIYLIYKTRVRKELDIWYRSMLAGYAFLALAIILGVGALLSGMSQRAVVGAFWALFAFFAFLINGHLYKIVPFLVWFHRFSELVGKRKVPMLHEMYPKRQADIHFWFTLAGFTLVLAGLLFGSDDIFKAGGSFLVAGAIFLVTSLRWMLAFKE